MRLERLGPSLFRLEQAIIGLSSRGTYVDQSRWIGRLERIGRLGWLGQARQSARQAGVIFLMA